MTEKKFNLLEEPWIKVLTKDMKTTEVSLKELFANAHKYKQLAGEMPTQDFAILRLLLAITLTVIYRFDSEGNQDELSEENDSEIEDVLARWKSYQDRGSFNSTVFDGYLDEYSERFWLIHPETPFYQVPNLQYGTKYKAICLRGNIKGSNNSATAPLFSNSVGKSNEEIEYAEASRWLVHLIAFQVNVKTDKEAPGTTKATGIGRMGQIGPIYIEGTDLFETLMLNLVPVKENEEVWGEPHPTWEKEVKTAQGIEVAPPDNLPELYTIQSRRIMLSDTGSAISEFRVLGADFYNTEDDFNEPMTLWDENEDKKTKKVTYKPHKHRKEIQAWREFAAFFDGTAQKHKPGLVSWIELLRRENLLQEQKTICFRTAGMIYGEKSYTYGDCIWDSVTLSAGLIGEKGEIWRKTIVDEIEKCQNDVVSALTQFSRSVVKNFCKDDVEKSKALKEKLVSQFYSEIDFPFREWLRSIDPKNKNKEEKVLEWERQAYKAAKNVVYQYASTLSAGVFRGIKGSYTIPQLLNFYYNKLNTIYMSIFSSNY